MTGGAGFIGSHTCVLLLESGYDVVIIDNLSNSKAAALTCIEEITRKRVAFVHADLRNRDAVENLFSNHRFNAVIHFAGLKCVSESVENPLSYYDNNLVATMVLLDVMRRHHVRQLVFSSSATVYGEPETIPLPESAALRPVNPYGRTKLMVEKLLKDVQASDPSWRIAILRYFNPVGAHPSGLIGEDPSDIPNNLMPYISKVAAGVLPQLRVYGNDYPTPDGTGIRDYIHVMDLAEGHLKAMESIGRKSGLLICNLGTGRGYSVLEMIAAFEEASKRKIAYQIVGRRPGDVAVCYADPALSERQLGWKAGRDLSAMCRDAWHWQSMNPKGYPAPN